MSSPKPKIVFIHGMFITKDCWNNWIPLFESRGYECFAPAWPYKDDTPENLRKKHPDFEGEGHVGLNDVVSFFESFIKSLDSSPILIGHSMGALITQILLNKGLGRCGVVIDSAPPLGVLTTKFSLFKANWPVLNPFTPKYKPVKWTINQYQYAFADHLSGAALEIGFEGIVPQSKLVPRDSLTSATKINYKAKTQPLLFIAGEKDRIIPASLNKTNYNKYKSSSSKTEFKVFIDRRHNLIVDKDWEEIADYVFHWIENNT